MPNDGPNPQTNSKRNSTKVFWRAGKSIRVHQRSGEGVVRRNGCPKGCFWRVRFFCAPLRFSGPFRCFKRKPYGGREETDSPKKHPSGQPFLRTTPSLLLWRAPKVTMFHYPKRCGNEGHKTVKPSQSL